MSDGQNIEYRARASDGTRTPRRWSVVDPGEGHLDAGRVAELRVVQPIENTKVGIADLGLSAYAKAPGEAATNYWY